jgi:hypothetical protein
MIESVMKPQLLWTTPTLSVEHKNMRDLNEGLARSHGGEEAAFLDIFCSTKMVCTLNQ